MSLQPGTRGFAILVEDIMRNISVKIFWIWTIEPLEMPFKEKGQRTTHDR